MLDASFTSASESPIHPSLLSDQSKRNLVLFSQILAKWYVFNHLSNGKTALRMEFLIWSKKYLNLFREGERLNPPPKLLCCSIRRTRTISILGKSGWHYFTGWNLLLFLLSKLMLLTSEQNLKECGENVSFLDPKTILAVLLLGAHRAVGHAHSFRLLGNFPEVSRTDQ